MSTFLIIWTMLPYESSRLFLTLVVVLILHKKMEHPGLATISAKYQRGPQHPEGTNSKILSSNTAGGPPSLSVTNFICVVSILSITPADQWKYLIRPSTWGYTEEHFILVDPGGSVLPSESLNLSESLLALQSYPWPAQRQRELQAVPELRIVSLSPSDHPEICL